MLKIFQRYVLRDVIRIFALAVGVFTGIVMLGLVYEFVRAELSLGQMLTLIPYGLPFTLPFTLPIAALLATSLTYGRLSADNEINAIRTSGVPIRFIVTPMVILGLFLSALSLYLQDQVIPPFHYKIHNLRMLAAKILLDQKEGYNFRRKFGHFQIYASYYQGDRYFGLVVFQSAKGRRTKIVAEEGKIALGEDGQSLKFTVYDGSVTYFRPKTGEEEPGGEEEAYRLNFPRYEMEIPIRARARREEDKSTGELLRDAFFHREKAREDPAKASAEALVLQQELGALEATIDGITDAEERVVAERRRQRLQRQIGRLGESEAYSRSLYRKGITAANARGALAFACLLAVVLGTTLPILMNARNPLVPFGAGTLIVILVYFPLHKLGIVLGEEGKLVSPWIGPWVADWLVGALGGWLLWKVLRR